MWELLSRPLEWLGSLRIGFASRRRVRVGNPTRPDAAGGFGWREYLDAERLFDAWGPVPGSPWTPYHAVPLFAAIDRIRREDVGPPDPDPRDPDAPDDAPATHPWPHARPGAPRPAWLTGQTMVIVDLPGPAAVEVGAWLVEAGCQPVCTFDNWPHPRGVLEADRVLAALLDWTTTVVAARHRLMAHSPPVWICDSGRLGERLGRPGEFDNRYYLDDSILPGAQVATSAGLSELVYVTRGAATPTLDLDEFFIELHKAGLVMWKVNLPYGLDRRPLAVPERPRPAPTVGYHRSSAGGFGSTVPQPSSGSSG